jgi:TniQ
MSFSDIVLPLQCEPYVGESGMGYCLRTASRNGATLHAIRRLMDMPDMAGFSQAHASVLARLFQLEGGWLRNALPAVPTATVFAWYGHDWITPYRFRRDPQICPRCVHHHGYAKAVWDVSLSTLCLEHGCWLIDSCAECGQRLRWDRPSLEVGHCGHVFRLPNAQDAVTSAMVDLQVELESRFDRIPATGRCLLPHGMVDGIGLDGWIGVVIALGVRERAHHAIKQFNRHRTGGEWVALAMRAIDRASLADPHEPAFLPQTASVVAEAPLIKIARDATAARDVKVAMNLLRWIFGEDVTDHAGRLLQRTRQMELFRNDER